MSGSPTEVTYRRVLLTGAAGRIGTVLRPSLGARFPVLRLFDRRPIADPLPNEEVLTGDLTDNGAIERALENVDAVVHMAGIPRIGDWNEILPLNIAATYALLDAARRAGVRRFVFASSNHAVGYYPRGETIDHTVPVRPDCGYGLSKAFGEAAARMFADKYAMSTVCLRIGTCVPEPYDRRTLMTWISPRDMQQLTIVALECETPGFEILYGVSANRRAKWDNRRAFELGYRPQDDSERYAARILAEPDREDPVAARFHGGAFAADEFVLRPAVDGTDTP
jgi:uronate dehydrogenase